MRYLTLGEVLALHERLIRATGGANGVRDYSALQSALAQPRMTFDGADLYPDPAFKATALALSLIQNHPFLDGNKRIGHAAAETFLILNGHELESSVDESERIILGVAAGSLSREDLLAWIARSMKPIDG